MLVCWERQSQVNATFSLTKMACIQGILPTVPILNFELMEWSCYILDWSWSLLVHVGLILPCCFSMVIGKSKLAYFIFFFPVRSEKSHLLHAPPWLLLTCDIIFTWLQNLIESLRYVLPLLYISFHFNLLDGHSNQFQSRWFILDSYCEVLTFNP